MISQRFSAYLKLFINISTILMASFSCVSPLMADEVLLRNGDRLTGEVIRQDADVLNLKTAYAGTLEIEQTQVREVILCKPSAVLLDDETVLEVVGFARDGDRMILHQVHPQRQ